MSSWNTREWSSNDRSRLLWGSLIRAPSQIRSRKATSSARSAGGHGVRDHGQGRVEPVVGVALVDEGGVDVEDHPADRPGGGPSVGAGGTVGHAGSLRGSIALGVVTTDAPGSLEDHADPDDDLPEQMRIRREKREQLAARGMEPYGIGLPITATIADVRSRVPRPAGRHVDRRPRRDRRPGDLLAQHRQALLRDAARRRRHRDPGDALAGERRRGRSSPTGRTSSTSATTCSSRARSSPPSAASCPCSPTSGAWRPRRCAPCRSRTSR